MIKSLDELSIENKENYDKMMIDKKRLCSIDGSIECMCEEFEQQEGRCNCLDPSYCSYNRRKWRH